MYATLRMLVYSPNVKVIDKWFIITGYKSHDEILETVKEPSFQKKIIKEITFMEMSNPQIFTKVIFPEDNDVDVPKYEIMDVIIKNGDHPDNFYISYNNWFSWKQLKYPLVQLDVGENIDELCSGISRTRENNIYQSVYDIYVGGKKENGSISFLKNSGISTINDMLDSVIKMNEDLILSVFYHNPKYGTLIEVENIICTKLPARHISIIENSITSDIVRADMITYKDSNMIIVPGITNLNVE